MRCASTQRPHQTSSPEKETSTQVLPCCLSFSSFCLSSSGPRQEKSAETVPACKSVCSVNSKETRATQKPYRMLTTCLLASSAFFLNWANILLSTNANWIWANGNSYVHSKPALSLCCAFNREKKKVKSYLFASLFLLLSAFRLLQRKKILGGDASACISCELKRRESDPEKHTTTEALSFSVNGQTNCFQQRHIVYGRMVHFTPCCGRP